MQNKNEIMIGKNNKKYQFWGGFGRGFWEGLGGFGGYKNKIEKKGKKRRTGTPGTVYCSWALPI